MQAVILAAGMGKRLKNLTQDNAKCMVQVNGVSLIERALRILDKKGMSKIVIVVGYKGEKLVEYVKSLDIQTPIVFVENQEFDKTNNIYSLLLAKEYLVVEDTILLESDIIFEERLIDVLLDDPRDSLALVDKFASWMDGTCLELDENDAITEFIPGKFLKFEEKESYYKTVNIYKFSQHFSANIYFPFLEAYFKAMGVNEYYESVIKLIAMLENCDIRAKRLSGQVWYEIDDIQDLDIASTLFAESDEKKYHSIAMRYGGYWRYPKMLDFCYLVNPFFPNKKMMDELKSNFDVLVSQYPSGMSVNALLAAKIFGVQQEHIVIGNGAAELIKELTERMSGKMGIITPTFEEYNHRFSGEIVAYRSDKAGFQYTAQDIMSYFEDKEIDQLVLINPDNPSGNYIQKEDIIELIKWSKNKGIALIVDESFVDFVDGNETLDETLIAEDILSMYSKLFVVKSISKSYGVPGLRLGVLASCNEDMISELKKMVAIWNINSLAEYFMQIFEKYRKDYLKSLSMVRDARAELIVELNKLEHVKAFPSQGNYVLCEIEGLSSEEFVTSLLHDDIMVKDLSGKINNGKEYVRIAVRSTEDNLCLLHHVDDLFGEKDKM